ncbi:unnamed protein product [Mycena citricolor]|uniref:BHLH domain-containing protein n=1 Tax=Mycena citricolor TaxID=2018698 RepID=A0AAD2HFA0_9AGAR|nr:unnamed protein product [Mycena citricolor]
MGSDGKMSGKHETPSAPTLMSGDLGLDPSDPLNLLLHNSDQHNQQSDTSTDTDSVDAPTPPDWNSLSAMWPSLDEHVPGGKDFGVGMDMGMDFGLDMDNMDMSFDAVGIEPHSLYHYTAPESYTAPNPFQLFFLDQQNNDSKANLALASPLSDTASGISFNSLSPPSFSLSSPSEAERAPSLSSGSPSPLLLPTPPLPSASSPPSTFMLSPPSGVEDSTELALASKVLKSAGVQLGALPGQGVFDLGLSMNLIRDHARGVVPSSATSQLPYTTEPTISAHSNSAFTTTPVVSSGSLMDASTPVASSSRPKTSHTTIERRYRTNLNARILALRAAVPALRVVDRAAALKASTESSHSNPIPGSSSNVIPNPFIPADSDEEDVIDAQGLVDGVKLARKNSKATVLLKATEYIHVLKNRERRLKKEVTGLKSLIRSLVGGGDAGERVIRTWESEWGALEGPGVTHGLTGLEEDDDEDGDDDSDEEGRKRKKPKMDPKPKATKPAPKPAAVTAQDGQPTEKKKRGRPRKVVPTSNPATSSVPPHTTTPLQSISSETSATAPARQYLLGAFALFSFFANVKQSPPVHHTHEGHVLARLSTSTPQNVGIIQSFHLLVSVLVLTSVTWPLVRWGWSTLRAPRTKPSVRLVVESEDTDSDESVSVSSDEVDAISSVVKDAERCILNDNSRLSSRLSAALRLNRKSESRLLALLMRPVPLIGGPVARALWDEGMGLTVEDALARIDQLTINQVLRALEGTLATEGLRDVAARCFVQTVLGDSMPGDDAKALRVASELGGRVGNLASRVRRVQQGYNLNAQVGGTCSGQAEADTVKLLHATSLYRQFLETPTASVKLALRAALGSSNVFEESRTVEEAKDLIVDMLTAR